MTSPLSHALANVMKRVTVITVAMVYTARPVTALHLCGISLSVFGALFYQQLDVWMPHAFAREEGAADVKAPGRLSQADEELEPLRPVRSGSGRGGDAAGGGVECATPTKSASCEPEAATDTSSSSSAGSPKHQPATPFGFAPG